MFAHQLPANLPGTPISRLARMTACCGPHPRLVTPPVRVILAGDHATLRSSLRTVLEMDPHYPHAGRIGEVFIEKGMYAEAMSELEKWGTVEKQNPWYWGEMTYYAGRVKSQSFCYFPTTFILFRSSNFYSI